MPDSSSTKPVYVVITEGDGPFDKGELIVCGQLPGTGVREIGFPGRKPLKWDCEYERYDNLDDAIRRVGEVTAGPPKHWHPVEEA